MLSKLKVIAFHAGEGGAQLGVWTAQINPEGYQEAYRTVLEEDRGIDTAGTTTRYKTQRPQDLRLEFVLDASGAAPGVRDVAREIAILRMLVYAYNGDAHSPNQLLVIWGALVFPCLLVEMDVDYTLFQPNGRPIRARVRAAFREHRSPERMARRASKRSADLSHARVLLGGRSIALECDDIYKDSSLHVAVARANDLDDLRSSRTGAEIWFPPLDP